MPKTSGKQKLLKLIENTALTDLLITEFLCEEDDDARQKEDDIINDLLICLAMGTEFRYSVAFLQNVVPKSKYFITDVLWSMDEDRFKQIARVSRNTFQVLLDLIKDDESFNQARSCKQLPIETQLIIVLYRLGSSGEGATISKIARLFGVGDGGTIQNITDRIFDALLKHKDTYMSWPNASERQDLVSKTWMELPNCIGYVDGTEIPLAEKPSQDPEAYFSRKHSYSLKVQAVCDCNLQIIHLVLGYPGSVHDARIFNSCELSSQSENFFSGAQWLAGDSAYKLSLTVMTPFRANSRELTREERTAFNMNFSKYRIRIEHCFGRVKERFNSLKCLKIQIKDTKSVMRCNKWVLCCALLHNIIEQQNDYFHFEIEDEMMDTNLQEVEEAEANLTANSAAASKRRALCRLILSMNN